MIDSLQPLRRARLLHDKILKLSRMSRSNPHLYTTHAHPTAPFQTTPRSISRMVIHDLTYSSLQAWILSKVGVFKLCHCERAVGWPAPV
jgi:hypothetical protein